MVCIYCGGNTQVTNSRLQKRNNTVWRRRLCSSCCQLFTTIEQADLAGSIRIIHDTTLKPFSRDQLLMDVYEACKHRTQPLEDAQALTLTMSGQIIRELASDGTISHAKFTDIILTILERFDPVAATVYKAYHR